MMGAGIAYVAAKSGIDVVLKDISVENAKKGKSYSDTQLRKQLTRGRTTIEKKAQVLRYAGGATYGERFNTPALLPEYAQGENQF